MTKKNSKKATKDPRKKKMPKLGGNSLWMRFPTPEEAEAFVVTVENGEGLARTFMPMPEVLEGTRSPTP